MTVALYDSATPVPWPATAAGSFARGWLAPFLEAGPTALIPNVHADLRVCLVDDVVLPYTLTRSHPDNSYVVSPYTHYVAYGREELHKLGSPALVWGLDKVVAGLGAWCQRGGLDQVAYVNNWLLSTNLYPRITASQLQAALHALVQAHPDRAIVFRSVDELGARRVDATLRGAGARPVFSRVVWYQDARSPEVRSKKSFKIDGQVLRRSGYRVVRGSDLPDAAFDRLRHLYDLLYLRKYSDFNPQFTTEMIRRLCRAGLLQIRALERDGRLDGVLGFYERNGLMTAPVFGYDTGLPQEVGLYRMLSRVLADEAQQRDRMLHCSAGVGAFKKHRGSVPVLEHNLVYDRHLPAWRRRPWAVLAAALDRIGVPIILRHEL